MDRLKRAASAIVALSRETARKVTRKGLSDSLMLIGVGITATGLALAYLPAGVMLGGIGLVAWALLIFDVGGRS